MNDSFLEDLDLVPLQASAVNVTTTRGSSLSQGKISNEPLKKSSRRSAESTASQESPKHTSASKVPGQEQARKSSSSSHKEKVRQRSSDPTATKENNRPGSSSSQRKDSATRLTPQKGGLGAASTDKSPQASLEAHNLLRGVKDIVKFYAKQQTAEMIGEMQSLYVNSQASLMKQLMLQSDDIVEELRKPHGKDSSRVKVLVEENAQLRQENFNLRLKLEQMQKKLDDLVTK